MMLNRDVGDAMPRTRAVVHGTTNTPRIPKPASAAFRPGLRPNLLPYLFPVGLFAAANGLMYVGDSTLLRHGFPWALVSLLVVAAAGSLWGVRPAILVLALSVLFGDLIVPESVYKNCELAVETAATKAQSLPSQTPNSVLICINLRRQVS